MWDRTHILVRYPMHDAVTVKSQKFLLFFISNPGSQILVEQTWLGPFSRKPDGPCPSANGHRDDGILSSVSLARPPKTYVQHHI